MSEKLTEEKLTKACITIARMVNQINIPQRAKKFDALIDGTSLFNKLNAKFIEGDIVRLKTREAGEENRHKIVQRLFDLDTEEIEYIAKDLYEDIHYSHKADELELIKGAEE